MSSPRAGVYSRELPALDRYVQVGLAQGRVLSVEFPVESGPDAITDQTAELLDRIEAYFAGSREEFDDVPVALTMQTDHRRILETVQTLPYGESTTVEAVARMTPGVDPAGDTDPTGLVRDALTANPAPVLVPDHRVVDGPSVAPAAVVRACRSVEGI